MRLTGWKPAAVLIFLFLALSATANAQTYVQSKTNAVGSGGNNSATFSAQPTAGNTVVVGLVCYGPSDCQISSIADNFSNPYAQIGPIATYGGPTQNITRVALYCSPGVLSGSNFTVTASLSNGSGGDSNLYIAEYSGLTCNVDGSAGGSDTGTPATVMQTSSVTTTNASDLLVAVAGASTGNAATAGSGYTLRQNGNTGVAEYGGFEDRSVTATGTYSPSMTLASSTSYWAMAMAALKAGSGTAPSITGLSPTSGVVGTSVTITGAHFGTPQGTSTVKFNNTTATATSWTGTSIVATVPSGATSGNVIVTVGGVASNGVNFTVQGGTGGITYIQSQTAAVGGSGNDSATFPSQPGAGDTVVVGVVCYGLNDCQVSSITDNFSNSYSQIGPTATYGGPTQNITRTLLYCASGIATGSNFTVTAALSNTGAGDSNLYIAEYSGLTCNVDQSGSGSNNDNSSTTLLQTSSATTTNATDLLVSVGGASTGGATTAGSGYVLRQNGNSGIAEYGGYQDQAVTTTGSYNASMTLASNTSYSAIVFAALKSASGSGTAPTITSLSPTAGAVGASVTIAGVNFGATQGSSTISFNGIAAAVTSWSAANIVAIVPATTTGNVVVTVGGVASNVINFTVVGAPAITSLNPTAGAAGASVTITGTNFGAAQGSSAVTFNGTTAAATSWSTTSIVVTVPSSASTGNVVVLVGGVNSNPVNFTVMGAPNITSLNPTSGAVGAPISIAGSNFGGTQGTSTVKFNGTTATVTSWSDTGIVAPVPSSATAGNVLVFANGVNSNGVSFSVVGAPNITTLNPTSGTVGTPVTVTGTNFGATQGSSVVSFNGAAATATSWSATSVVAIVPAAATTGNVVVTVSGVASNGVTFTVQTGTGGITYIQSKQAAVGSSGNNAATFVNQPATGDTVLAGLVCYGLHDCVISSVSDNFGNLYTQVGPTASYGGPTQNITRVLLYCASNVSSGSNFTVSAALSNAGGGDSNLYIAEYSGLTCNVDQSSSGSETDGTATTLVQTSAATTTNAIDLLAVVAGSTSGGAVTAGSGYHLRQSGNNMGAEDGGFEDETVTATGSYTGSMTLTTGSSYWATVIVALKGVSGSGAAPNISSLSPTSGGPNTPVTISGSGFGTSQGSSRVTFNGTAASPTSWNATTIVAAVPSNATTGPVVVAVNGTSSNGVAFTISSSGTIAGTVTRASDGTGINGASVQALQSGVVKGSTTTAANGSYSITGLAPGVYDLAASANGFLSTMQASNLVTAASTTTVNLILGAPTIASLTPSSGLAGQVVTVVGSFFGTTQGSSTISFNGVFATPSSWGNTKIVAAVPSSATTGPVVVTVTGLASAGVSFTVGTGTITGTVTNASGGAAISGATVAALQSNTVIASTTTASNGTYTLSALTPGTYDVRFSASGFGTSIQTGQSVTAGNNTTVNASLSSLGTISGKVTKPDGITGISGASVAATQNGVTAGSATTDSSGTYSISSLAAGSYSVQVAASGYNNQTQTGVAVTVGNTTTLNIVLTGQSVITYSYDAVGRLTGAVDSQGYAAVYNYDSVGNLLSISRNLSSQISISGFTPQSGPAATSVTINGTSFSSTPSQNTVKFNGTSATVTAATTTQLIVAVPSGATTGTISVTAPSGTATSTASFTVTASSGAPTISGFTPTIGVAGTAMTISGTNFDSLPANDKTRFNLSLAQISSATSTSLSTTVPLRTTSGHVTVSTAIGKVISSGYFFVPPPPYTVSNVGFTGSVSQGGSNTATISTAGQVGLMVFDGTVGQQISLQATSATFGGCAVGMIIYKPDGTTLISSGCMGNGGFIPAQTLNQSGTYTILIVPGGSGTGSLTLNLYNVVNLTGTITPGGSPVNLNFTTPGQTAKLTFSGTAAQRVSVQTTAGTLSGCSVSMTVQNPDASSLTSNGCMGNGGFIGETTLPTTGTYTLFVQPGSHTGTMTVNLNAVTDITGTITPGGSAVNLNFTTPGQTAKLTFSGTAAQRVSVQTTAGTLTACSVFMTVQNPDASTLTSNGCMGNGGFIGETTLPTTGTYTLFIQPGSHTGTMTVNLYAVTDITGTITPGGSAVNLNFTTPGQTAKLTFSGTAAQRVSVQTTSSTLSGCTVAMSILKPDASTLTSNFCMGNGGVISQQTLPTTGTYTLFFQPGANTGNLTVTMTTP